MRDDRSDAPLSPIDATAEGLDIQLLPDGAPGFTLRARYFTPGWYTWYRVERVFLRVLFLGIGFGGLAVIFLGQLDPTLDSVFLPHRYLKGADLTRWSVQLEAAVCWLVVAVAAFKAGLTGRDWGIWTPMFKRRLTLTVTPTALVQALPATGLLDWLDQHLGLSPRQERRWDLHAIDGFEIREHPCRDPLYRRENQQIVPTRIFRHAWEIRMSYQRYYRGFLDVCERDTAHALHSRLQQLCGLMRDPEELAHWPERRALYDPVTYPPRRSLFPPAPEAPGSPRARAEETRPLTDAEACEVLHLDARLVDSPQGLADHVATLRHRYAAHPAYLALVDRAYAVLHKQRSPFGDEGGGRPRRGRPRPAP